MVVVSCNRRRIATCAWNTCQQGSGSQGSGMDGQTLEVNTMPQQQPQQQQANVSQNVQGCASTTNLDASGEGYPVQRCQQGNMPVMQGQGPAWFGAAMDSPTANVYAADCASACTEFWLCEYAWWTKVWLCSKLRSEPDELPRKHAEWPSWSEFGRFQEVMAMLGNLNEGQLQTVQQHMQDRFVTMQQRRGFQKCLVMVLVGDSSFVTPQPFDVLPGFGVQQSNSHGNQQQLDVFAKSKKWLTPAPSPVSTWKSREEEVLGWAGYLDELSSWAAGGSLEFSVEIQHSSRWPGPIRWSTLSSVQQARSRRLMSILKAAFHDNPRCVALVNAFSEGVALHGVGSSDRMTVAVNQQANGFELLRQLTLEFSTSSTAQGGGFGCCCVFFCLFGCFFFGSVCF